ncbi:helix-turn-helix transcriptional regulator [Acetobacter senegalensis]|uniref:winged helix-turn-helix transcriptional regulator n=1 Tax=Acetobacter senegalensis TaxID=446692 RepID=UPI0020A09008|nr:helix-turn-helix domain-containing protein [Acetobacter senegalensis]MCP1196064.1 helix-turn-helix transcriptional regulator [Acetobacter senegalensis]
MTCSVAAVMGAIGDRWAMLIMRDLILGLRRYDDLRRSTNVTNATLSDRLKALEENGLVERRKYRSRPDRFEYVPTEKGWDVGLLMQAMVQIGDKWNQSSSSGPPLRFVDEGTGHGVKLAPVDMETGALVEAKHVRALAGSGADDLMQWRLSRSSCRT